jgi:hypothetical protein
MKSTSMISLLVLFVTAGVSAPATAQNVLGRLESDIRQANGQPPAPPAAPRRVYLGAIALDDARGGVRITSVGKDGPAQQAGLQAQDLVVGAAGKRIQLLSELKELLGGMNPGDRVPVDIVRGTRRMQIEVVLGGPSTASQLGGHPIPPPPSGAGAGVPALAGAGRSESVPPPPSDLNAGRKQATPPPRPGDLMLPSPADGPALNVPTPPTAPNNSQAQIEELRHRVDQLERRVQELEKALAEARKK